MRPVRQTIGGLGNLMFKNAYLWAQMRENSVPDVYVQGEKYWSKYADEIRQLYGGGIGYDDRVALHIRRGDYLKAPEFHVNLWQTDYYARAIEKFPSERFLVFCKDNQNEEQDKLDREWCKYTLGEILGDRFDMHNHGSEVEDLNAMASCKHIIMANSSFSWWAAYLNPNPQKRVICPRIWFTDRVERVELLPTWELI